MVSYNGKEVIYTFKYGGQSLKKIKKLLILLSVCCAIMIFLGLLLFILMFLEKDKNAWTALISFGVGLFGIIAILIVFLLNRKHEKVIYQWLADENLFENKTVPWEVSGDIRNGYRFGIDFKKKGQSYRKISSKHDKFYKKIEGKEIKILYSPKYDEVMVLETTEG